MNLKPNNVIMILLMAVVGCYLLAIMSGVFSCIVAWFLGMNVSGCSDAFKDPLSSLLAAVTGLWAATRNNNQNQP